MFLCMMSVPPGQTVFQILHLFSETELCLTALVSSNLCSVSDFLDAVLKFLFSAFTFFFLSIIFTSLQEDFWPYNCYMFYSRIKLITLITEESSNSFLT